MPTIGLTAGFLPLFDSALLVLAHEKGFAETEGLALRLIRETSWANIRDRSELGHFDLAVMLAPMPIAANLGLTPIGAPMIAPFVLGLGNNAVTVSADLWSAMAAAGAPGDLAAGPAGVALAKAAGGFGRKLRFGVVHRVSSHNYELRYWLAASGLMPDRDVEIVVLPPALLPDALGAGRLDGYCVGEPWNSVGVARHGAHIATVKTSIWQHSPDKIIGTRLDWAEAHPDVLDAVLRALHKAAVWLGDSANHAEAARIMSGPTYLGVPAELVERTLRGRFDVGGGVIREVAEHFVPYAGAANFPWRSHALWYYSQMLRWGETVLDKQRAHQAAASFRPDLYRRALAPLGGPIPLADSKVEGARLEPGAVEAEGGTLELLADTFFDGGVFDPVRLEEYVAGQAVAL
jgi:ABC-type nitrate/sulfonate/bicarbonate transport system substrate-binding protein